MSRFRTALTDRLGIEHPILLAPMAGVSGGRLAAAVSNAGGLGLIGGGYGDPAWLHTQIDEAGDARIGIGFITWALAEKPELLDIALACDPAAVLLSFGDAAPFAGRIKDAGAALICQVQTVGEARAAAEAGADAIVAQGAEAGGHGRTGRGVMALTPAIVDAVAPVPVAAGGGIADGRGLAAALTLGAGGVMLGTRFYACVEALGGDAAKRGLVAAEGDRTLRTTVPDLLRGPEWPQGYDGRMVANDATARWHGREQELRANLDAERERYAQAAAREDFGLKTLWAGEGVDMVRDVEDAATLVNRIVAEAADALTRSCDRLGDM